METIINKIEQYSSDIDIIVDNMVNKYSSSLDDYVIFIKNCLQDGNRPPTTEELEDFCLNLSSNIYFTSSMVERVGIKEDISKLVYKEAFNNHRNTATGTVADKNTTAEIMSQKELLINICYNRTYKTIKAKIEASQDLLSSCKKVLSVRLAEMEMTRVSVDK